MFKNDMPTFLSSGFKAASTTRAPAPPLRRLDPKVDHGNSGEVLVTIKSLSRARSYDVTLRPGACRRRHAHDMDNGHFCQRENSRIHWRPDARHQLPLPGSRFRQAGHTDWSDSVARICAWEERCNGRMKGGRTPLSSVTAPPRGN